MWLALAIALSALLVLAVGNRLRRSRLAVSRGREGLDEFVAELAREGIDSIVAVTVFRFLQDVIGKHDFPVRRQDGLAEVYGLADEDLDDGIAEIFKACGGAAPLPEEELDRIPAPTTVDALARLISRYRFPGPDRSGHDGS